VTGSTLFRLGPLLTLGIALVVPASARAELLYFQAGGQVQAPATVREGRVRIETPGGDYWFLENDFRKIVPGHCPEREWAEKRDASVKGGAPERTAAAWWSLENGLTTEAVAMLRSAREADPTAEPAARMNAMLDRLERPVADPPTDSLDRALAVSTVAERGPHVLLLHQHGPAAARSRVALIESVITTYYLTFAARGMDLTVPRRRLVSVYLRDRNDYLAFLRSQHAGAFQTTLGYYHPTYRAVVAYDERTSGKSKATPDADAPRPAISDASPPDDQELRDPRARDRRRRRMLHELELSARNLGTAAHETVHLLVNESGLAPTPDRFPMWLHEGLATQYEVVRGGRWAGPGRAHDLRLADWRCQPHPDLGSLITDAGFGQGYRRDVYAGCWALVYFLQKTRPEQFYQWLDVLRIADPSSSSTPPLQARARFEAAFGADPGRLNAEWKSYMNTITFPLLENGSGCASQHN